MRTHSDDAHGVRGARDREAAVLRHGAPTDLDAGTSADDRYERADRARFRKRGGRKIAGNFFQMFLTTLV